MKGKALLISAICILFVLIGAVSASDVNDVSTDDLNLVQDSVSVSSVSMEKLEVSSNNSISETNSHNYNLNQNDGSNPSTYEENENSDVNAVEDKEVADTYLVADNITLYMGNGTKLYATLFDGNGTPIFNQSVIFTINNMDYTRTTNKNGSCSIAINLPCGVYEIGVRYTGSDNYNPTETNCTVTVLQTIFGSDITKYFRNGTMYIVHLLNGTGQPYANVTVKYNINGVFYTRVTDANGTAKFTINLGPGTYIITAWAPNGDVISNNVTVLTIMTGSNIEKYFQNTTPYVVTLLDDIGKPYANATVTFNINGVFYNRVTDANGIARLNINLPPNTYIVTAITPNGFMISNNVTVLSRIVTTDLNKYYLDSKTFNVTLLSNTGQPEANKIATCNIGGVLTEITSDAYGVAHLPVYLEPNTYIITTTYGNESVSNEITVNIAQLTISGNDVQGFENRTVKFPITLTYPDGSPVVGQNITINVAGKQYSNRATNENGTFNLILGNLTAGEYLVTYYYSGNIGLLACNGSNIIKIVNSTVIINADDLTAVYGTSAKFNVTLMDLDSKPMVNKIVTISINGIDYDKTTNADGVASLNINLLPGNYTINYHYSTPDMEDYASGSNLVTVEKRPGNLIAQNVEVSYGQNAKLVIEGYDVDKQPIIDEPVRVLINGNSYTVVLTSEGKAYVTVNLPVGVFNATYCFADSSTYICDQLTSTITVTGYKLSGTDVTVSKGTQSYFEVTVTDTYGNPVTEKAVTFEIAGNVMNATTDENGIAKVLLPALDESTVINYYLTDDKKFTGQNNINVASTMQLSTIINGALALKNYIESNNIVPDNVGIGGVTYTTAQFLYLLSKATISMSGGVFEGEISIIDVANPINGSSATVSGNLYDYVGLANSLITYIEANGAAPVSMSTAIGESGFYPIVYALARTVAFYQTNGVMPAYVSLKMVSADIPSSPLDTHNTITDLEPYLQATTNCQVNSEYIQNLAATITKGLTSEWAKAQAIFNYVRDHVSYSFYYNTRHGAVATLTGGSANCCDHAHAVVALARAAGLPARYVHGTCKFTSGSTYGHVWAQILIGDTWVVADATSSRNSLGIVNNWNNYAYTLHGYYRSLSF